MNKIEDIPLIGPLLSKMLSEIFDVLPYSDEVVNKNITIVKEMHYSSRVIYYKHNNLCLRIVKNEHSNISDFGGFRIGYGRIENPAVVWLTNKMFHCTPELNKTIFDIIVTLYQKKESEILKYKRELNEHCC